MDGVLNANNADLDGSSIGTEICENPISENSPSSTEQEVNNEKSLDTDFQDDSIKQNNEENKCTTENTDLQESEHLQNGKCNGDGPQKKTKRNVSFPSETLVMGFLEPPDPWKNAPPWKTEDLLKAYKLSCEKHGTKPLNKILQQLQCIENIGERYEILSLKGERLDMRQCESLEEIFKRVRFRCIDLEATHLDDEMAVSIFEMVEYYESACKLNISFNKTIGPRGWQSCARLVRKTPPLTFIDARNCDLNERVIPFLGRSLRNGCFLSRLQLQSANLAGRALVILVAALKENRMLKELFIGDNKFMPTDGVQIGNLLRCNNKLELLDLRNNHLQDVGVGHICVGLSEQQPDSGLLTLVLWNNQITFQAMASISKALTATRHLETLNLGHNPITNEGIHILKDGLLKSWSLLKLGLSGTKITCEGAVALAEYIADSHRVVRLDLQENEIKTAGLMALALALKMNESLTRLELDRDTKKESGVRDYMQQQKRLQQEIATLLDKNRDIAHRLAEEKQQIEAKNRENARKLEEAAKDIDTANADSPELYRYIPSEDKIHRPKLLFLQTDHRAQDLESPAGGFPQSNSSCGQSQLSLASTATAPSVLLSPQYCPNPRATAKKLFSVTRVTSPIQSPPGNDPLMNPFIPSNMAPADLLNAASDTGMPGPHLCPPLPEVPGLGAGGSTGISPSSPAGMQRVIEEHTLVSYIQQIIDDSSDRVTSTPCDSSHGLNATQSEMTPYQELDKETVAEGAVSIDSKCSTDKKDEKTETEKEIGNHMQDNKACGDKNDNCSVDTRANMEVDGSAGERLLQDSLTDMENCANKDTNDVEEILASTQQAGEAECDKDSSSNIPEVPTEAQGDDPGNRMLHLDGAEVNTSDVGNTDHGANNSAEQDIDTVQDCEPNTSHTDVLSQKNEHVAIEKDLSKGDVVGIAEDSELNSEFVDCLSLDSGSEFPSKPSEPQDVKTPKTIDSKDHVASSPEQWNTVNKSDILDIGEGVLGQGPSDTNANTKKPDFHTSLSLNGMRQELASLIDEEGNPTLVVEKTVGGLVEQAEGKQNGVDIAPDWIDASSADETPMQASLAS